MNTIAKLDFGLIGCGDIGQLRARALAAAEGCRLVAVADVDGERANRTGSTYGAQVDRDWRSMLQREDIDAVIVATPPSVHAEMCLAALEAGKHVLCEKPLARTADECRMILGAAETSGRQLAVGFNYRFYPSFDGAREAFHSGVIGELDHIRAYAGYSATGHNQPWVHDAATVGGGALRDNGIHLIDLTRHFLGEVVEVKGFATDRVWGFEGCEDNGFALLRNKAGQIAALQASWTEWRRYQFRIELYGSRGCIRATCFPMMLEVVTAAETGGRTSRKREWYPTWAIGEKLKSYRWVVVKSFVTEFEAMLASLNGAHTHLGTGIDGLRSIEIAEAATQGGATWADQPGEIPSVPLSQEVTP